MKDIKVVFPVIFSVFVGVLLSLQPTLLSAADNTLIQELSRRIDAMGREINELRGENEKLNYELGRLRQNQKKGFLAIDERLEKNQQAAASRPRPAVKPQARPTVKPVAKPRAPAKPARPVSKKPPATAKTAVKPAANNEKAAYNHAYETLKGNRQAGINEFKAFLVKYPTSRLAENAHYWIGEANYRTKNYRGAIDSFVVVLNKYKSGRKAPDAAVKLGYSFYALKDWTLARRTFNDVLRYFPGSNAAKLAKSRLDRMQKEGH